VSGRFEKLMTEHGVTVTEWVALRTLYNKTQSTQAELIEALGMTKSAASKVVTRLEAKGLAIRISAAHSARE
jgi:DNA-binding MarR family transcriptional regulator